MQKLLAFLCLGMLLGACAAEPIYGSAEDPGPAPVDCKDATLAGLSFSVGTLGPTFSPQVTMYLVYAPAASDTAQLEASATDPDATISINGSPVGAGMASLPITLGPAATPIALTVQTRCGTTQSYSLIVVRGSQYMKASNTHRLDQFGTSVSLSGDTLAVGAVQEFSAAKGINGDQADTSAAVSGAVYVFQRTGTTWAQQAYIKASNTEANDEFGFSVSLSGDTLAVGARMEASAAKGVNGNQADNSASGSGAVYVYQRTGTTWGQQAYIKASNTKPTYQFGSSVSIAGDTLAVGSFTEASAAKGINGDQADTSAQQSGAVYVFQRTGTTWVQQAYIKASNAKQYQDFGWSVAVAGDTLAVGAPLESSAAKGIDGNQADTSAVRSGAVYVFQRAGSTWSQQAYVKASNTGSDDYFGWSVSLSGDTLAVAAYAESSTSSGINGDQTNNGPPGVGAVYVFQRAGTAWSQQAYIKSSAPNGGLNFGYTLSLSGDLLAVGTPYENSDATGVNGDQTNNRKLYSGATYVFRRSGTAWSQSAYLKASNTGTNDNFGYSVAVSGQTVAVGAPLEDSNARGVGGDQANNITVDSGAAYIFP